MPVMSILPLLGAVPLFAPSTTARLRIPRQFSHFASRFLLPLLAAALVPAQTAAPNKGKALVDQAIQALGGERFLNMHTRHVSGRIYAFFHDQMSGYDVANIYTQYLDDKDLKGVHLRERQVLGKKQDYSYLYLPDQAFDITFRGARPLEDERRAPLRPVHY